MKKLKILFCVALLLIVSGTAIKFFVPSEHLNYAAPALIPNVDRNMKCAGFWIALHPYPNGVILSQDEISALNRRTESEMSLTNDILKIGPQYDVKNLKEELGESYNFFLNGKFYNAEGKRVDRSFYRKIGENIAMESSEEKISVRYGFLSRYADERLLPTDEVITEDPFDIDFDQVQNSSFDAGTPLVVLYETKDKAWYYCVTPESSGWFKKELVAICTYAQMAEYLKKDFCVVTAGKTEIFLDGILTEYYDYARMGSTFAVTDENDDFLTITIPFYDAENGFYERQAYLRRSDAHSGFLAYTPRTIIEQAFKLLNAPYGWGGANGEQDCSSFLKEIFATTGIRLPRNSAAQAKIGRKIAEFEEKRDGDAKLSTLKEEGVGGITLIQLKGHIILYLGQFNNRFYVIHETSGYRDRVWWHDRVRTLRRAVVSDLSLGAGSKKGSLLERILVMIKVM